MGSDTRGRNTGPFTGATALRAWLREWSPLLVSAVLGALILSATAIYFWTAPRVLAGPPGPSAADLYSEAEVMFVERGAAPDRPAAVGLRMGGVSFVARTPHVTAPTPLEPRQRVRIAYQIRDRLANYSVRRIEPLDQPSTGAGSPAQR